MAATGSKITTAKVKPISIAEVSSRAKLDPSVTRKKIESSTKPAVTKSISTVTKSVSTVTKSVSTITKSEVKSKNTASSSKTTTKTVTKAKEKKVYTLPGQKHDPPEEREPLRIFYESLSHQIPTSEMAEFWMMEHGLLSPERAKKAHEKKQRKQKQMRMGTPIKSPPPPSSYSKTVASSSSSLRKPNNPPPKNNYNGDLKAKKRLVDSDDDDFILSSKKRRM